MKSFRYKNMFSTQAQVAKTMNRPTNNLPANNRPALARPRGAALVTAMLITLVLSGLGLIALHSVNDTTWKTANYRSRQQASQVSDSIANLAVYRLGDAGNTYVQYMHKAFDKETGVAPGYSGSVITSATKSDMMRRGPYVIFARTPAENSSEHSINYLFTGQDENDATVTGGIFDDAAKPSDRAASFGDNTSGSPLKVDYRFIIRDELDGPPATGFDRTHCFKKVTVASHSHIAPSFTTPDDERAWSAKVTNAAARNMVEIMVGPIPCGEK